MLKWQQDTLDRVKSMTNGELVDNTLSAASGDDYDGGFTARGAWEFDALKEELLARLLVTGFLTEAETETIKELS